MAISQAYFNWYDKAARNFSTPSLLTNNIKIALTTSSYTPDSTAHEFFDVSITGQLPTAVGYTSGGKLLTTKAFAESTPGNWKFSSDNVAWVATGGNLSAKVAVMYDDTPASDKPLIGWWYLNYNGGSPADVTVVDGYNLIISVPAAGWFTMPLVDAAP